MVVEHINNDSQFSPLLQRSNGKLLVVDFYADWCGPCRFIAPHFEQLADEFSDAIFAKVNVDNCQMTCGMYGIRAMPSFVCFVDGREVGRIQGADLNGLRSLISSNYRVAPKAPEKPNHKKANDLERRWLHDHIVSRVDRVMAYEDEINQTLALSVIPLEDIKQKSVINGKRSDFLMAKNLMNWFHDDFFSWVDQPECDTCHVKTTSTGSGEPTPQDREQGGDRVELYKCETCNRPQRFVRYNNPATLIETRRGRCGEWANCFALCCRAVDLETRIVLCTEDHIWVEIFDSDTNNWIHCDPCENIIDRPLLYDKGWKKEIKYAFAIAKDHVQEVTWRYVFDHKVAKQRRRLCRDSVLLNCIWKLNQRLQKDLPAERKEVLHKRQLRELIQFLTPELQLREGDEVGRTSGSLAWRLARMETTEPQKPAGPVEIEFSEEELKANSFVLEYDVVNDVYTRPNNNNERTPGVFSLLYQSKNINRKVEEDWKMAYLCRTPGSKSADVSWKISLAGLKVKKLSIHMGSASLFHSGRASSTLCGGMLCSMINDAGDFETTELSEAEYVELSINLRGGEGENAWQHAQIFRNALNEPKQNLRIEIELD